MTRRPAPTEAEVLQPLTDAALNVCALRVSLPDAGRVGSGTARTLAPHFSAWGTLLAEAGAEPLPTPRVTEEGDYVVPTMGDPGGTPMPLAPHTLGDVAALAARQGAALAGWVAGEAIGARERMQRVADTFRDMLDAVRERVRELRRRVGEETSEAMEGLRTFLRRWADGAMQVHRDMMDALGRAAWGAGAVAALLVGLWAWSRKRG